MAFVTDRYVTWRYGLRVARDRSDTRWSEAQEPWERLVWARSSDSRFAKATTFARHIGIEPHTYARFERPFPGPNASKLTADRAKEFAGPLDVRWEWLLWGELEPWREGDAAERPAEAREAADIIAAEEDPEERRRMLDVLRAMKRTGTDG